MEILSSNITS